MAASKQRCDVLAGLAEPQGSPRTGVRVVAGAMGLKAEAGAGGAVLGCPDPGSLVATWTQLHPREERHRALVSSLRVHDINQGINVGRAHDVGPRRCTCRPLILSKGLRE